VLARGPRVQSTCPASSTSTPGRLCAKSHGLHSEVVASRNQTQSDFLIHSVKAPAAAREVPWGARAGACNANAEKDQIRSAVLEPIRELVAAPHAGVSILTMGSQKWTMTLSSRADDSHYDVVILLLCPAPGAGRTQRTKRHGTRGYAGKPGWRRTSAAVNRQPVSHQRHGMSIQNLREIGR